MKKLITLLLVLTGMVSTASADTYTVIFKPSSNWALDGAWFALYMEPTSGTGTKVAFTETSTGSGYYKATYNSTYDKKIQICRMNPASESLENTNVWTWSTDLSCPSSDILIDNSGDSDWNFSTTETALHSSWLLAANRHIANDYKDWEGNASENENNVMTSTDGINYTVTVSNKPIKAGSYGYKFVGDNWYGDNGNNYIVEIANDDFYDITYTFNRISKIGSAVATAKSQSPTITYSYYIYDNDAASWSGITAFTGKVWSECEMTNINGTYVYAIAEKTLTSGNRYGSRLLEKVSVTGQADQYNWLWISDAAGGSQGCRYYDCTADGTYNIVFTYKPSDSNYDMTSAQPKLSVTTGFYAANSSSWSLGSAMTFDATKGIYKYTFNNINGKYFVLSTNANVTGNWDSYAIRPESGASGSYDINSLIIYNGTGVSGSGNGKTWYVNGTDINKVDITFNPIDYHWQVTPYLEKKIYKAAEGYATFSADKAVAIPDGVTAKFTTSVTSGTINWTDIANGIPADQGALLYSAAAAASANEYETYYFAPATTTDDLTGNLMKPIASKTQLAQSTASGTTNFILSKVAGKLGFYMPADGDGSWCNAGTAYLQVADGDISARGFFLFDDDSNTTAIEAVKKEQKMNGEYYNLAGQRVAQPTKGLYIVNGKKVIVK